jgi:hypothetical protein
VPSLPSSTNPLPYRRSGPGEFRFRVHHAGLQGRPRGAFGSRGTSGIDCCSADWGDGDRGHPLEGVGQLSRQMGPQPWVVLAKIGTVESGRRHARPGFRWFKCRRLRRRLRTSHPSGSRQKGPAPKGRGPAARGANRAPENRWCHAVSKGGAAQNQWLPDRVQPQEGSPHGRIRCNPSP